MIKKNNLVIKIIIAAFMTAVGLGKALRDFKVNPVINPTNLYFGLGLILAGTLMWIAGRTCLGKAYTITLSTPSKVVKKGIYKHIRHPIYLGLYLFAVGIPTTLSPVAGMLMAVMALPAMIHDILTEEKFLKAKFKNYKNYCRKTKRAIPFVW